MKTETRLGHYVYAWKNWQGIPCQKRLSLKGRRCVVLAWGNLNSCMVEFCDNSQREIISRNALRKTK
jgi:hypothetical protein